MTNSTPQPREDFAQLLRDVTACRRCEAAVCGRRPVLGELNGDVVRAEVLVIGEAPGRQGGDRTRVPFSGDQSGRNFSRYLDSIKLSRTRLFITNAALCNPRTPTGANRAPTARELQSCAPFLRRQLEVVNPRVVVTLGRVALAALKSVAYHDFTLKEHAGTVQDWWGRQLVPLYHPSPQVLASHRREAEQLRDYQALARAIRQAGASRVTKRKSIS